MASDGQEVIFGTLHSPSEVNITDWFSSYAIAFIQKNDFTFAIMFLVSLCAVVYVIGHTVKFAIGLRGSKAETTKTSAEALKVKQDFLEKFHNAENVHAEDSEFLNLHLAQLIEAMREQKPATEVDSCREELINHYCQHYLSTLGQFLDHYRLRPRRERVDFIESTVIKELETAKHLLDIVNIPHVLDQLNRTPLELKRASFGRIWGFCRESLRFWNCSLNRRIKHEKAKWE